MKPLRGLEHFLLHPPQKMLLIGGMPRSGTSSCDRYFQDFADCFMADEFHPVTQRAFTDLQYQLAAYGSSQLDIWQDSQGRDWRGFTRDAYKVAQIGSLFSTLILHSSPDKRAEKDLATICVFGLKLPNIEQSVATIADYLSKTGIDIHFIYCARDPRQIFSSLWEMPWITEMDEMAYVQEFSLSLSASLNAYRSLRDEMKSVWLTGATPEETTIYRSSFAKRFLWQDSLGARAPRDRYIDEWPRPRRRAVEKISDAAIHRLEELSVISEYRMTFFGATQTIEPI